MGWQGGQGRIGVALAAPAVVGLVCFVALPFVAAVVVSFSDLRLAAPTAPHWVGWAQYMRVLGDPLFRRALANNLLFAAVVVPVQTALALALAVALHRRWAGRGAVRALLFLPVLFPMALVAVVWTLLLAPGPHGPVNALLAAASGGAWRPHDFLHDPHWALPAIIALSVWQGMGFQMVILAAGLEAIPPERYEAARVDGAGPWRRLLHVTVPGLAGPLTFVVVATSILAFRLFDQVRIMTRGGPSGATTTVIHEAVVATFDRQEVARGAAMTTLFFLLVAALALIQRRLFTRGAGR